MPPHDVKDHIRPKVNSRRGDQTIFHVTVTRDESNHTVQQEHLNDQDGIQFGQGLGFFIE